MPGTDLGEVWYTKLNVSANAGLSRDHMGVGQQSVQGHDEEHERELDDDDEDEQELEEEEHDELEAETQSRQGCTETPKSRPTLPTEC
jgi:hypothetical protein